MLTLRPLHYLLCCFTIMILLLTACTQEERDVDTMHNASWQEITQQAYGSTVRYFMWGGSARVNQWIDGYVANELKKQYTITLERIPMDAPVFINKLLTEKAAGKSTGTIDMVWINGENFKNAQEAGLLYGPFVTQLPNFLHYVDPSSAATDFGFPVNGYEAPYGRAQFVFEYDTVRIPSPPTSFRELSAWVKAHPGRFTYPQPPDFTGSAFIRQAFYAVTGGHEQYMGGFDRALFAKQAPKLWAYLNDLEPYLWQQGRSYPKDPAFLSTLFARGEVDFMMAYHPTNAQGKILEGVYPQSVRTFVMKEGSIYNTHFNAIPANAPNKAGAMVVCNFMLSPEVQRSKFSPANWGDFPALDLQKLSPQDQTAFAAIKLGEATLSPQELSRAAVPEIPAAWLEALETGWEEHVLRK